MNEIAAAIGGPVQHIVPNPRREFEEARKAADCSRAKSAIGWEPRVAFAEGIRAFCHSRRPAPVVSGHTTAPGVTAK